MIVRQRARSYFDPISQTNVAGDWAVPDETDLDGAWIAQSSTSSLGDATRTGALEFKSLYCDPDADVQLGDRIRSGSEVYAIDGIPVADTNPWTGWQPVREVPLKRVIG